MPTCGFTTSKTLPRLISWAGKQAQPSLGLQRRAWKCAIRLRLVYLGWVNKFMDMFLAFCEVMLT